MYTHMNKWIKKRTGELFTINQFFSLLSSHTLDKPELKLLLAQASYLENNLVYLEMKHMCYQVSNNDETCTS
jgi:hypothetical protein